MKGFSKFVEIRTFWYGEKFAYAIGTRDSSIGAEKVIKVPYGLWLKNLDFQLVSNRICYFKIKNNPDWG